MGRNSLDYIRPLLTESYMLHSLVDAFRKYPQVDIPVKEELRDGIYTREIFMPKDTIAIGEAHTDVFFEAVLQGKVIMFNAIEEEDKVIEAPYTRIASAGHKKFGYVVEDTIWITSHYVKSDNIKDAFAETVDTKNYYALDSQEDFKKLLVEINLTDGDIKKDMDSKSVILTEVDNIFIDKSSIHGVGVFANVNFCKGEPIGIPLLNGKKTHFGRYVNHSHLPNCKVLDNDGEMIVVTLRTIIRGEELTYDYRNNMKKELE